MNTLAEHVDVVAHGVENATALQAGRQRFIDKADRNGDADDAIFADAQEVGVQRRVFHRADLQIAGNNALLFARDINLEYRRGEAALQSLLP